MWCSYCLLNPSGPCSPTEPVVRGPRCSSSWGCCWRRAGLSDMLDSIEKITPISYTWLSFVLCVNVFVCCVVSSKLTELQFCSIWAFFQNRKFMLSVKIGVCVHVHACVAVIRLHIVNTGEDWKPQILPPNEVLTNLIFFYSHQVLDTMQAHTYIHTPETSTIPDFWMWYH